MKNPKIKFGRITFGIYDHPSAHCEMVSCYYFYFNAQISNLADQKNNEIAQINKICCPILRQPFLNTTLWIQNMAGSIICQFCEFSIF
jgi:hypothetical protein